LFICSSTPANGPRTRQTPWPTKLAELDPALINLAFVGLTAIAELVPMTEKYAYLLPLVVAVAVDDPDAAPTPLTAFDTE